MLAAVGRRAAASAARRQARAAAATTTTPMRQYAAATPTRATPLFINNEFVESESSDYVELLNPATQELLSHVPLTTQAEMRRATDAAAAAFPAWRATPVPERVRVMLRLQQLVKENADELAHNVVEEHGKTLPDAHGSVLRGYEVVEHACSAATLLMGETLNNVARNIDTYSYHEPLGVCAGICPFNFPAMIPLWMFPLAIVAGNTFVLKPSEKDPGAAVILARLAKEAGLPPGVLNVIHGTHNAVNFLCDDSHVKAVSFVGSNVAGEHIHARATANLKRVQSNMAAKNHAVVLPDANKDATLGALIGASFGAAGQRCMALTTAVFVGDAQKWIDDLVPLAQKLKVGAGIDETADLGPLNSKESVARVERLVQSGIDEGARCLVDGRGLKVADYPHGNWMGPTLLDNVTEDMECHREEIFGPVLLCMRADSLDDAIALINRNPYGNGTAVFTRSGAAARKFEREIEASQVGINIPIPVPLPCFSFTGGKNSFVGSRHFYGKDGIRFFTQAKTITANWNPNDIPTGMKGIGAN